MSFPLAPRAVGGIAALASFLAMLGPSEAADAANGARIAKRWCAECHIVAPGQTSAKTDAPPFASIAARPPGAPSRPS